MITVEGGGGGSYLQRGTIQEAKHPPGPEACFCSRPRIRKAIPDVGELGLQLKIDFVSVPAIRWPLRPGYPVE